MSLPFFLGSFATSIVVSYIARFILLKSMKNASSISINLIAVAIPVLIVFIGGGAVYYSLLSAVILFLLYQTQNKSRSIPE